LRKLIPINKKLEKELCRDTSLGDSGKCITYNINSRLAEKVFVGSYKGRRDFVAPTDKS
jgi:hypothetical protein